MYDEPPDPEPNPCAYCEAELGHGEGCDHCAMARLLFGRHKSERRSGQGLGFGGAEFTVRLDDGREFFTDNNWSAGQVPPHLRKLLRSNAVFIKKPPPEAVESPTRAIDNEDDSLVF